MSYNFFLVLVISSYESLWLSSAIHYQRCLLPQMLLFLDSFDVKRVCVNLRVDICVHVVSFFFSGPVTLHLVIQQPHMRDRTPNAGMTPPPLDRDLADLLKLSRMWFHFEAPNMACIKHNAVNWMSGFTLRCVW